MSRSRVLLLSPPLPVGRPRGKYRVDMPNLPGFRHGGDFAVRVASPLSQEAPVRHPRRRRLSIFSSVFLLALAAGLTYSVMQPAEYRATARLEIVPASPAPPGDDSPAAKSRVEATGAAERGLKPFRTEVQVLTSRPL